MTGPRGHVAWPHAPGSLAISRRRPLHRGVVRVFFHAKDEKYNATWLEPVGWYGNDAVMIFFVLSGFVIAFVANGREDTFDNYMVSRLARLWSVVIPALLLTMVADTIGLQFDPEIYADGDYVLYREFEGYITLGRWTFELIGTDGISALRYSNVFMNHYVVGGLFTLHLWGMMTLAQGLSLPDPVERAIRWLAGMTFSLYLFHHPLLMMYASLTKQGVAVVVLTLLTIMVLAPFTEGRKRQWRGWIEPLFRRAGSDKP